MAEAVLSVPWWSTSKQVWYCERFIYSLYRDNCCIGCNQTDCQSQLATKWFCFFQIVSIAIRFCKTYFKFKLVFVFWMGLSGLVGFTFLQNNIGNPRFWRVGTRFWTEPEHWIKKLFFKQACFTSFFSWIEFPDGKSLMILCWWSSVTDFWRFGKIGNRLYPDKAGLFGLIGSFFKRFST